MTNFIEILSSVNGASFIAIDTESVVTLTGGKANPQKGRVTKRTIGSNVVIFQNKQTNGYDAMVKRRLEAEGKDPESFELGPRAWGTRLFGLPLVEHEKNGELKYYFEVIFMKAGKSEYFLDGQPIAKEDIIGLPSKVEDDGGQGGLENKVIIRTYALDSIIAIRINHEEHFGPFTVEF